MDADTFRELVYGTRAELAAFFGVSQVQLRRYLNGRARIPIAIARLAAARFSGELAEIYGTEAADLRIRAGFLLVPGWRRGISLQELRTLWVRVQAVAALQSRIALLERDLEAAATDSDESPPPPPVAAARDRRRASPPRAHPVPRAA